MTLHLRQYVVGPEPLVVNPDWLTRQLPSGLHLSHCPTLPVTESAHGLVLGDAVQTESSGEPDSWAGRWLRLTDDHLRLDACGLLACYLRVTESGRWASSSPEILRTLDPELPLQTDRLDKGYRYMDWYPPPHSAIVGIERLLPSQALPLDGGPPEPVRLAGPEGELGLEEVIERWSARLIACMHDIAAAAAARGGRPWLALTSGRDSRVLLAALQVSGVDAMTFTFHSAGTSIGDREVPQQLASAAGLEHVAIPQPEMDPARAAEFDRHVACTFVGSARSQYASRRWEFAEPEDLVIEGGCLEAIRGYYWARLPRTMPPTAAEATRIIVERFPSKRPAGVRAWVDWMLGPGHQDGMDWRDRFYIEQRAGGWISAGRQGFDLTGRRMVLPANCHALLSDALSLPAPLRARAVLQDAFVRRLAPGLADHPYNPGSKKERRKARRAAKVGGDVAGRTTFISRLRRAVRRRAG